MLNTAKKVLNDSLYKNSLYLMISTGIMSVLGFVFWLVIARLFDTHDVGLATTIISVTSLITSFSIVGLNIALIRYLPTSTRKNDKINTAFTLVAIITVIVTAIYLMGMKFFSPDLMFIHDNLILSFSFILFMILSGFNTLTESIFTAFRSTKYILIKNTLFSSLKIIIPFGVLFLGFAGSYAIFSSWMIAMFFAFCFSLFILIRNFQYSPEFAYHDSIIRKIGKYSVGNYLASFFGGIPTLILPLLITNTISASTTAHYYIAMMVANLLFTIPSATSQSLFAEGSRDENNLEKQTKKSIKIISLLLIPGILITLIFGKYILLAFGREYSAEGFRFLQILAISGIFVAANSIFGNLLRVKNMMKSFIVVNFIRVILVLGPIYLLIDKGLTGIGIGWLIGMILTTVIYAGVLIWERRR